MAFVLINVVAAAGISSQLKRTNPGIAGKRPATMIFDVVNTDTDHKLQMFLLCNSPDDVQVTSSFGAGTGAAQYVSPLFFMEKGPSQEAITVTLEADSPGDKHTGCIAKYIPYREKIVSSSAKKEDFEEETTFEIGLGKNINNYVVTFEDYSEAVEDDEETENDESEPAKVSIDVDGTKKTLPVGGKETFKDLNVEVVDSDENEALLLITGQVTKDQQETIKVYQKMNGEETTTAEDNYYRVLRLDKTLPFAEDMSDPQCPEGKNYCTSDELVDKGWDVSKILLGVGILLGLLGLAYVIGSSRK